MSRRLAVHVVVLCTVIASSAAAVTHLATQDRHRAFRQAGASVRITPATPARAYRFERLTAPARTVVRDERGVIVATFTDGARTAVINGPTRTFQNPTRTQVQVTTPAWVRLTPEPWSANAEHAAWLRPWLYAAIADRGDDVLAVAAQYLNGAAQATDAKAVRFRGDARFGRADFSDYLGVTWSFPGGPTEKPEPDGYGALDPAGYVRMVYGYRAGYPLRSPTGAGTGLPRTPAAMAALDAGAAIPADRLALQPGDLVFLTDNGTDVDTVGIFFGLDQNGRPRFLSSRKRTDGPAFSDGALFNQGNRKSPALHSVRRI
ncbi:hypothetical protein [Lentzea sp. NPDC051838]|uniref:hypothetical protein n=1 Tax=Lentzea sp. NPDC051838 TaxID=3154849 RepID=UPI00341D93F3